MTDLQTDYKGKILRIYLKNGFHYKGDFLKADNLFLFLNDHRLGKEKALALSEIREIEVVG